MKKTSLKDIAESLGVSKALVSLVLNGKGDERGINKETQARVRAKAKELNYVANEYARGLRVGKSNTIGVIVPDISNIFYGNLCKSIEQKAYSEGFNIIISNTYEDSEKEIELISSLIHKNIDGLILASSLESSKVLKEYKERNFPLVLVDRVFEDIDIDSVSVSNRDGAEKAIEYLINEGKKKIACLTISPVYISSISERIKGYLDAIDDKSNAKLIQIPHDDIFNGIEKAIKQLEEDEFDAVFCVNNNITKVLLQQLNKNKIETKYKIVSFDDLEVFDFANPKVTSVAQPINQIGEQAATTLIEYIKNPENHFTKKIILKTDLIIR